MRLLITRPEPDASDLAQRLSAAGHDVLVQPLTCIVLAPQPPGLAKPGAIAFTSRNGVRAVSAWRAAESWRNVPVYAVGAATAAAARGAGFGDVRVAEGDVTALATLVQADADPAGGPILYPAGRDRRGDLAAELRGFTVATVEAYRADAADKLDPAVAAAIRAGTVDGVLVFSARTAELFATLVAPISEGLGRTRLFAMSEQVAQPLRTLPGRVVVAPQPNEASLLSLLGPINPALARLS